MTDFDPNKYLTTRVHGGVREIVGEEAKKIRERVRKRLKNEHDTTADDAVVDQAPDHRLPTTAKVSV